MISIKAPSVARGLITGNYQIISLSAESSKSLRVRAAPSASIVPARRIVVARFRVGCAAVRGNFLLIALSTAVVMKRKRKKKKGRTWFVATLGTQRLETFNCTWKRLELFSLASYDSRPFAGRQCVQTSGAVLFNLLTFCSSIGTRYTVFIGLAVLYFQRWRKGGSPGSFAPITLNYSTPRGISGFIAVSIFITVLLL